jgi:hypothetical protein
VGDQVEANYRGNGVYYHGKVKAVHTDQAVDIDVKDNGDKEAIKVPLSRVRFPAKRRAATAAGSAAKKVRPAPAAPVLAKDKRKCGICKKHYDANRNAPTVCRMEHDFEGEGYPRGQCPGCREWDACECGPCQKCGAASCGDRGVVGLLSRYSSEKYCYCGPHTDDPPFDTADFYVSGEEETGEETEEDEEDEG